MNLRSALLLCLPLASLASLTAGCASPAEDGPESSDSAITGNRTATFEAHERIDVAGSSWGALGSSAGGFTRSVVDPKTGLMIGAHPEKFVVNGKRVFRTKSFATGAPESAPCGTVELTGDSVYFDGSCGLGSSYTVSGTTTATLDERIDLDPTHINGGFTRTVIDPKTGLMLGAHPEKFVVKGKEVFQTIDFATGRPEAKSCGTIDASSDAISFDGTCGLAALYARSSAPAASTSTALPSIASGKYIRNGQMLMIYGRCSPDNFLGAAKGALGADGRTISVEEGDVCGSYALIPQATAGVVSVKWNKPEGSHLGPDVEQSCRSLEGSYAMTVSGAFEDVAPGIYRKGSISLRVDPGCTTPSTIGSVKGTIVPKVIGGTAKPFFQVEEGNVCGGYLVEKTATGVRITWQKPEGSHLGAEVESNCASVDGSYAR